MNNADRAMEDADGTPPVSGEGNIAGTETTMAEQDASSGKWVVKDGIAELVWRTQEKVSVTFMINGEPQVVTVVKGESVTAPKVEVGEGYVFVEWRTDLNDPESVWEDGSAVTVNTTVYAYIMEVQSYVVKFDANGGTGTMEDQQFGAAEEKALAKNTFTREGYKFVCWEFGGEYYLDGQVISMLSPTGADVVMKAVWVADSDPELVPNGDFSAETSFTEDAGSDGKRYVGGDWLIYTNAGKTSINSVSTADGSLVYNATLTTGSSSANFYVAVKLEIDKIEAGDKFVISFDAKVDSTDFTYVAAYIRFREDATSTTKFNGDITEKQEFILGTDLTRYSFIAEATEENVAEATAAQGYYLVIALANKEAAGTPTFTLDNVSVKKFTAPKAEKSLLEQKVTLISDRKEND